MTIVTHALATTLGVQAFRLRGSDMALAYIFGVGVDIAERQMSARRQVIELVAMPAVAVGDGHRDANLGGDQESDRVTLRGEISHEIRSATGRHSGR